MEFEKALEYIGMAFICGKIAGKALVKEEQEEKQKQGKHEVEKEVIIDATKLKGKEAKEFTEFLDKLIGGKK